MDLNLIAILTPKQFTKYAEKLSDDNLNKLSKEKLKPKQNQIVQQLIEQRQQPEEQKVQQEEQKEVVDKQFPYLIYDKNDYNTRLKIGYTNKVDYEQHKYIRKIIDELNKMYQSGENNQKKLSKIYRSLTGKRIGVRKTDRVDRINNVDRNRYQVQLKLTIEDEKENEHGELIKKRTEVTLVVDVGVMKQLDQDGEKKTLQELLNKYVAMGSAFKGIVVSQKFKDFCQNSLSNIISAEIIDVIKVDTQQSLLKIAMQQFYKQIFQLGNTEEINPNKGQCVPDFLKNRLFKRNKTAVSEATLIKFFGENYRDGITLEKLAKYCNSFDFSLHAFTIFGELIYRRIGIKGSLSFFLNNKHAFPVIDKNMIKSAVESNKFPLSNYKFDVVFDQHEYFDTGKIEEIVEIIVQKSIENKTDSEEFKAQVIILNDDNFDISDILTRVGERIKYTIIEQQCDMTNRISAFKVPGSAVVVIGAKNFEERKCAYDHLNKVYPTIFNQFRNQSYAQMALELFENIGKLSETKSYLNENVFDIFDQFPVLSQIGTVNSVPDDYQKMNFDINKSYSNLLLNCIMDFNLFCVLDIVEKYDGREIVQGEFFVNKNVNIKGIKLNAGFFPYELVQVMLKYEVITKQDITQMLIPQKMIPSDFFREFVCYCYQSEKDCFEGEIPLKFAKMKVNCFTGILGKRYYEQKKSAYVNSQEEAFALFVDEEERGNYCNMYPISDQFFVISTRREKLLNSYLPIYRQIIARGIIQLISLAQGIEAGLSTENNRAIIAGFNTDSVSVFKCSKEQLNNFVQNFNVNGEKIIVNTSDVQSLSKVVQKFGNTELNFGGVKKERFHTRGDEILFDQIVEPEIERKDWNEIPEGKSLTETVNYLIENPGLVIGIAGSGKTQIISEINKILSVVVLCFTNKAVDNLRQRGVENVFTFDSFEIQKNKVTNLIVDEVSMINSKHMNFIYRLKMQGVRVWLFGDFDQCPPVENNSYDYFNNEVVKEICEYQFMKLDYKENSSRFDRISYEKALQLINEGKIDHQVKEFDIDCSVFICKTNKKRKEINKLIVQNRFKEFVDGICISIGCRYLCKKNDKNNGFFNGQLYQVIKYEEENVELKLMSGSETKVVSVSQLKNNFCLGFCRTMYSIQGETVRENIQICEANIMLSNEIFTAITRSDNFDKVSFVDPLSKNYRKWKPIHKYLLLSNDQLEIEEVESVCKFYFIDLGQGFGYVGRTERCAEKRLKEHIRDRLRLLDPFHVFLRQKSKEELRNLKAQVVEQVVITDQYVCIEKENEIIEKYVQAGFKLLNTQNKPKVKFSQIIVAGEGKKITEQTSLVKCFDNKKAEQFEVKFYENGKKQSRIVSYQNLVKESISEGVYKWIDELREKEGITKIKKAFYVDYPDKSYFHATFYDNESKLARKIFRYQEINKVEVEMRVREFIESKK